LTQKTKMQEEQFVIGLDFGTDSVRSVIIRTCDGKEVSSSVFNFPRWRDGLFCNPAINQFRQHPLDYIEGLKETICSCLKNAGPSVAKSVKAISIDTTGSTPVAVNKEGIPLALLSGLEEDENAMFVLWKDHTAVKEAEEINLHSKKFPGNYLRYVGGVYSSEWFWAKLLHTLRKDEKVRNNCFSWVEHCDWIPFLLTGGTHVSQMKRSRCAAGHKALWAEEFGGLPPDEFFSSIDPLLKGFTKKLFSKTYTSDEPAGKLSREWAERLGLTANVVVGVGAFDAHMGAVGGQIEPYYLSKVMGTSTCDILVAPVNEVEGALVGGICGQVTGSVIPGMIGMEAGQSAFGDTYAWFRNILSWPLNLLYNSSLIDSTIADKLIQEATDKIIKELSLAAEALPLEISNELSVDWLNGRRTPDANQLLKACISGLNLGTDAPRIFKSLVEATCFGAKAIVNRFVEQGIAVKGLIGMGGVAKKSPSIMQTMADVMNMPIKIHKSEQTCAAGAAMFAATAAGVYSKVEDAMAAMGQGFEAEYQPNKNKVEIYEKRYLKYQKLGECIEQQLTT
jgi:L-ribulokinase